MEELVCLLNRVDDSYFDFVSAMIHYAEKKTDRLRRVLDYIKNNPNALSSDIIKFVSEQEDFYEDAAYMNVG
jgi:hypothetical protein